MPDEQAATIIINVGQFGPVEGIGIVGIANQIGRVAPVHEIVLDDPLTARLDNQHFAAAAQPNPGIDPVKPHDEIGRRIANRSSQAIGQMDREIV